MLELYDMYLLIYLYGFLSIVYSLVISYLVFFEIYICVIETSFMKPTSKALLAPCSCLLFLYLLLAILTRKT